MPGSGVTGLPVLPWKGAIWRGVGSNISYLSLQNVANRSHEKQGHPPIRVNLSQYKHFGSPSRVNLVKASKSIRACASVVGLVNFFPIL